MKNLTVDFGCVSLTTKVAHPNDWSLMQFNGSRGYSRAHFYIHEETPEIEVFPKFNLVDHPMSEADELIQNQIKHLKGEFSIRPFFGFGGVYLGQTKTEVQVAYSTGGQSVSVFLDISDAISEVKEMFSNTSKELTLRINLEDVRVRFDHVEPMELLMIDTFEYDISNSSFSIS